MRDPDDKNEFWSEIQKTFLILKPDLQVTKALAAAWWDELKMFPLPTVKAALSVYRQTAINGLPTPGKIVEIISKNDGRPTAEEAWGIVKPLLGNESLSAIMTTEMGQPWNLAAAVWPDAVGARMTFIDAYERAVSNARRSGDPVEWFMSSGDDKDHRAKTAALGYADGRLKRVGAEQAAPLLPSPVKDYLQPTDVARENLARADQGLPQLRDERSLEAQITKTQKRVDEIKMALATGDFKSLNFLSNEGRKELESIAPRDIPESAGHVEDGIHELWEQQALERMNENSEARGLAPVIPFTVMGKPFLRVIETEDHEIQEAK